MHQAAIASLLALTLALFGDVLFSSGERVLSGPGADLSAQFLQSRYFGFRELAKGRLPAWNPHCYSGAPFVGDFLSAMFYPPNLLFVILPLSHAANWSMALHVFLAGVLVYGWASRRGLHGCACTAAAAAYMFGGAYFSHLFAGHLDVLCTAAWIPLLLLSIDRLVDGRSWAWVLIGGLAVAMQVLAGSIQVSFFTAVAAAVYTGLCVARFPGRRRVALGFVGMYAIGGCLSAVQILAGVEAGRESVRAGGVPYEFAATFSLPPENLLTLVAPRFFGGGGGPPYWGRCYAWETTLFFGVTGLALAVIGAVSGERPARRFSAAMVAVLFVLALGAHTPLFRFLHSSVPGFDAFRGLSKFILPAGCFAVMLAAVGLHRLLTGGRVRGVVVAGLLTLAAALGAGALWIRFQAGEGGAQGNWARILGFVAASGESYLPGGAFADPGFVRRAALNASGGLAAGAATLAAVCGLIVLSLRRRRFAWGLALLAVAEVFVHARGSRPSFDLGAVRLTELRQALDRESGADERILNLASPNSAVFLGRSDIWGYEISAVRRRYAEWIAFTQGGDTGSVTGYVRFSKIHRLYAMLRLGMVVSPAPEGLAVRKIEGPLPRVLLLSDFRVMEGKSRIFAFMDDASFDPRKLVVLEREPQPRPQAAECPGSVKATDLSTDSLRIEAELASPAILLVTDTYASGWRAVALPGSAQARYDVMPANYMLRAIPLSAGSHRLRLEYAPAALRAGAWISAITLALWAGAWLFALPGSPLRRRGAEKPRGRSCVTPKEPPRTTS